MIFFNMRKHQIIIIEINFLHSSLRNGLPASRTPSQNLTPGGLSANIQGFHGNRQTTWSSRKGVYQPVDQTLDIYPARQRSC